MYEVYSLIYGYLDKPHWMSSEFTFGALTYWSYKFKSDLKKNSEWFSTIEVGEMIRLSFKR